MLLLLLTALFAAPVAAQDGNDDMAKIKEQELEEVRERISSLKQSMDEAAEEEMADVIRRDRVDAERNLLLVKGAVPGSKGGDVVIRPAVKAR